MPKNIYVVLYILVMIAVVVSVDILFFRNRFWERLIVNIGIVLVFIAFYLRFLKNPELSAPAAVGCLTPTSSPTVYPSATLQSKPRLMCDIGQKWRAGADEVAASGRVGRSHSRRAAVPRGVRRPAQRRHGRARFAGLSLLSVKKLTGGRWIGSV